MMDIRELYDAVKNGMEYIDFLKAIMKIQSDSYSEGNLDGYESAVETMKTYE